MDRAPLKAHYAPKSYWSHVRIHAYANQLLELHRLGARNVLEIGMADGFISGVTRAFTTHRVLSCDLDPALGPDVAASVLGLPFDDGAFDLVMCCQVLEHLPFDRFPAALAEIGRVAGRHVLLSLPDVRRFLSIRVRLPKLGWRSLSISPERPGLGPYRYDGEHHWEIGYRGTRHRDVRTAIERAGFGVLRAYRIPELPYHACFVLSAAGAGR